MLGLDLKGSGKEMANKKPDPKIVARFQVWFLGKGHRPMFSISTKLPHIDKLPRTELNVQLFGYRIVITWERWK